MISIQRIGLQHLIAACAASLSLACSSSSPAPATGGNDSGGENDATMTPPSDAGTPEPETSTTPPAEAGADTGTGEGGPAALSCTSYCSAIMATCTGATKQYVSQDACMNACSLFPVGTAGDTSGNTLGCRTTHVMLATTGGTNPHCWHAGPCGYGACGDECANFCALATTWCTPDGGFDGGAPPYASDSVCMTDCAAFKQINSGAADGGVGLDGGFNAAGPASGNTLDCREWHLNNAFDVSGPGGMNQQVHCQHPGVTSMPCQ